MHTPVSNVSLVTAVKPKDLSHGHRFSFYFRQKYVHMLDISVQKEATFRGSYHPLCMFVLLPLLYYGWQENN